LQVADEMPPCRNIGRLIDFLQGFLHFVLAKVALSGRPRLTDVGGRERFRNGNYRNVVRIASSSARGVCHAPPDIRKIRCDRQWRQLGREPPTS
jgi:hypothetical protein